MKIMVQLGNSSIFTLIRSLLIILFLLLLLHSMPIKAQETDDDEEREFSYIIGSEKGPERWGDLYPDWVACKNGTMQSPIDIPYQSFDTIPRSMMGIQRNYKPQNATLFNRGHDIMLQWEGDAGSVLINGTKFALRQVHWHSPSEHKIDGIRYALELHMVHQSTNTNSKESVAVVAVLYRFGHPDRFLSKLASKISSVMDRKKDEQINAGVINPMIIQMCDRKFYKYIGSLTTPPCTEGVNWIVIKKIQKVSKRQVELLRAAVDNDAKNNARPLQPLNNRDVNFYFTTV